MIQLDVFNDDMAFTGGSYDQPLTTNPIPTSPIIGVIIISSPGTQFKWAKSHYTYDDYEAVAFSQDGALVATITSTCSGLRYILVLDSKDGSVKTA